MKPKTIISAAASAKLLAGLAGCAPAETTAPATESDGDFISFAQAA